MLMEKYNWTPEQIDEMAFFRLLDLEAGDWKEEYKRNQEDPVVFIDELGF